MKRNILVNVRLSKEEKENLEEISKQQAIPQSAILRIGIEIMGHMNRYEWSSIMHLGLGAYDLEDTLRQVIKSINKTVLNLNDVQDNLTATAQELYNRGFYFDHADTLEHMSSIREQFERLIIPAKESEAKKKSKK